MDAPLRQTGGGAEPIQFLVLASSIRPTRRRQPKSKCPEDSAAPSTDGRGKRPRIVPLGLCPLPRHDPVDVALVQLGGGVAEAEAAPVPVVAALVAVAAAGTARVTTVTAEAHATL